MSEVNNNEEDIVIVGAGLGIPAQRKIAKAIESKGIEVEEVEKPPLNANIKKNWPKDAYVLYDGKYYRSKDHGKFAEGGCVISGDGFQIISDSAFTEEVAQEFPKYDKRKQFLPDCEETRSKLREIIAEKVARIFDSRVHVVHSCAGELSPAYGVGHIDYYAAYFPNTHLLAIDEVFGRQALDDGSILKAAEAERILVALYKNRKFYPNPMNVRVVSVDGRDVVFFNKKIPGLGEFFDNLGIDNVGIDFKLTPSYTGGVGCATNIRRKIDKIDTSFLLQTDVHA